MREARHGSKESELIHTPTIARVAALVAATGLVALSAAPADAATTHVAKAHGTALTVEVGGKISTGSGSFHAAYDGKHTATGGNHKPVLKALGGQDLVSAGVLAQDAVAGSKNGVPYAKACSGVASDGATVVAVGDGNCIKGGDNVSLDVRHLDFSKLDVLSSDLVKGMDKPVKDRVKPVQDQLTATVADALQQGFGLLDNPAIHLNLDALQSNCTATGSKLTGTSTLSDVTASIKLPGRGSTTLADLPMHPKPNQKVVADLKGVTNLLLDGVRNDLRTSLGGALAPVADTSSTLDNQVLAQLLDEISALLAPAQQNLLDITLNKQTRTAHSIKVTALDIAVAPVAKPFLGADLAHIELGTSTCRTDAPGSDQPKGPSTGDGAQTGLVGTHSGSHGTTASAGTARTSDDQAVPTNIDAGAAGDKVDLASSDAGHAGLWAILGVLLVAVAAGGGATYLRIAARRK